MVGGLGWRTATDTARPANLAALLQAGPKVRGMAASASRAGSLPAGILETRLSAKTQTVESGYLAALDEVESVEAEDFLSNVKETMAANP